MIRVYKELNHSCKEFRYCWGDLAIQFAKRPALYCIGKTDFLYKGNEEYRKLLDSKGYPYEYFENEGGHIWGNWRIYLTEFVPKLFKYSPT